MMEKIVLFFRQRDSIILAIVAIVLSITSAKAELKVDITRGTVKALPIAVANFVGTNKKEVELGKSITSVISSDLERSGLFRPISQKAFIETEKSLDILPKFQNWRILNVQAMVQGSVVILEGKNIALDIKKDETPVIHKGNVSFKIRNFEIKIPNDLKAEPQIQSMLDVMGIWNNSLMVRMLEMEVNLINQFTGDAKFKFHTPSIIVHFPHHPSSPISIHSHP